MAEKSYNSLNNELIKIVGVDSARCYQCGKCSAGCPLVEEMDFTSSVTMRMLQIEEPELDRELLKSKTIWLCLSCEMCIARCPMEVDIPKVMDYLREKSLGMGLQNKEASKGIIPFHKSFLRMIYSGGRAYEMGLVILYKMKTLKLMQDMLLAPKMFIKGKLSILPERVEDRKAIKRIFKQTKNESKTDQIVEK